MITFKGGDIFISKADVIAHQVNCKGVMDYGFGEVIKNRSAHVYTEYKKLLEKEGPERCFGKCQYIELPDGAIANLFGQLDFGEDKVYTDLNALRNAMISLREIMIKHDKKFVAFPDMIGCSSKAGGNKTAILSIIREIFPNPFKVEIWKL